jgi:hypothetical protein
MQHPDNHPRLGRATFTTPSTKPVLRCESLQKPVLRRIEHHPYTPQAFLDPLSTPPQEFRRAVEVRLPSLLQSGQALVTLRAFARGEMLLSPVLFW